MPGGEGLQPSGRRVDLVLAERPRRDVTDGPYAETKEQLGGLLLLEARDMNHAIALMSQHPSVKFGSRWRDPSRGRYERDDERRAKSDGARPAHVEAVTLERARFQMSKVRVAGFSVSLDGLRCRVPSRASRRRSASADRRCSSWFFHTKSFRSMTGQEGGKERRRHRRHVRAPGDG